MLNTGVPSTDPPLLQADRAAMNANEGKGKLHRQLTRPSVTPRPLAWLLETQMEAKAALHTFR